MHARSLTILAFLPLFGTFAQLPLAIPPALEQDTFLLDVQEHTHQFYPGVNTPTLGVNGEYLGPTLIFQRGDTARLRVHNGMSQITTMHWHGMHVSGDQDGGPQRVIDPGTDWNVKYNVANPAGTYWYHPHPHMLTGTQATRGIAGMIIVRDDEENSLDLPRTYGVDDIPVVIQDRRFLSNGAFVVGPYGDSLLVNGTPHPYIDLPAQVVRLRLLNGSNSRVYRIGLQGDSTFHMIAGDGGLLNAPVPLQRIDLSNGERADILLDLTGLDGDSLLLMSFGSELAQSVPGSDNILWETSALNGIDFPVLRIRVQAPTPAPVTNVPATLGNALPIPENTAVRTRVKTITGNGMVGMGMFLINGLSFDLNLINDSVQLNATEIWTFVNNSNMAHPMHIHGVSFFVLDRNGIPPAPEEAGAKDVVLVNTGETVRTIMRFDHPTNGYPYMYHCHNLMHEDHMMMLQFIVTDQGQGLTDRTKGASIHAFPSPTSGTLRYQATFAINELVLTDQLGRVVVTRQVANTKEGFLDLGSMPSGVYVLSLRGSGEVARSTVVRE
ncbi:MAG: multicopper oxidase domain-containing protein [Flavobacteriales bacterium]|jgi:bilirubin oxidase|nr:multicopper oxidase domain-containing protein [Flavobacteriales bacterium]